ncbi:MAG: NUDIX domain-containing protein [Prevotella sp.]|nr:NUDIX domain-containing protein [Staphylococcus sp.]MCM1350182.1 NUDIX domain-containing protein [Prevotella sp.]
MQTIVYFGSKIEENIFQTKRLFSEHPIQMVYIEKELTIEQYKKIIASTTLIFMIQNDSEEHMQWYKGYVEKIRECQKTKAKIGEVYVNIPKKWIVWPRHCETFLLDTFLAQGKGKPLVLNIEYQKWQKYGFEPGNKAYFDLVDAFIHDCYQVEASAMAIVRYKDEILATIEEIYGKLVCALPKGHIEKAETIVDAAIRECLEETGIHLDLEQVIQHLDAFSITFINHHLQLVQKRIYPVYFQIDQKTLPHPTETRIQKATFMKISDFLQQCPYENIRMLIQTIEKEQS